MESVNAVEGIEVRAPVSEEFGRVLSPDALSFVKSLHQEFSDTRKMLLTKRAERQKQIDSGELPDFLRGHAVIAGINWTAADAPLDLRDRRVEITGPAGDRKMVINALNSGANIYMADFEDSQSPVWNEVIQGQINMIDAVDRTISFVSPEGKSYALNDKVATLIVRPRGWHLLEKHVLVSGEPISASLFDFGLFFFHNAKNLLKKGSGPYFYLPKIESNTEARLWDRVFTKSEDVLGIPRGSIRATVLIETLPAAFEMEEILYVLRDHIVGLNCGRWDYIFSYIKKLRNHPQFVLPDRGQVTMDKAFLAAYVNLLIKTCHKHGVFAIGGMSAYIPIKGDEAANAAALQKVRADKEREVAMGHDGTWVAHPALVAVAKDVFDSKMKGPNQLDILRADVKVTRDDLLRVPEGEVTLRGVQTNISIGLQYLESWLGGRGCVPINNLMEDAATAEISRAQLWQWARHEVALSGEEGKVTTQMINRLIDGEVARLSAQSKAPDGPARIELAGRLFERMIGSKEFPEFLTLPAYEELLAMEKGS